MKHLGTIERLQVQISRLKTGEGEARRYDPAPIRQVVSLRLTSDGVVGLQDGETVLDVHHKQHPDSVNREHLGSRNAISFNFTRHYRRMERRFSRRDDDGFAGENILIAGPDPMEIGDFAGGLLVETSEGDRYLLSDVTVAAPCRPFSRYMLASENSLDADTLRETLRFLNGGTRGFLCHWSGEPITIHVGDSVYLP